MTFNSFVIPGHDPESRWRLKAAMTFVQGRHDVQFLRHSGLDPEPL